ncbi:MAG: DUF2065 domain-containing protein [Cardiobacteriaceae bacterium]|nr:DUF2065 domain-containing protein [Cardiobacteriaceae bacterium]
MNWLLALVIVLFFEGAILGLAPRAWQRAMRELAALPPENLRRIGLAMSGAALALLALLFWMGKA